MSDTFMSLGLAKELEQAFVRTGWTREEVKELTKGETLRSHRDVLRGELELREPDLLYPEWVEERLTSHLEVTCPEDPGNVELWFHPAQETDTLPKGEEVYERLTEEHLLERSLSFGHLKWLEAHPEEFPADWHERRLVVFGWASVVRNSDGGRCVPYLYCGDAQPCVHWHWLGVRWLARYTAGLRK